MQAALNTPTPTHSAPADSTVPQAAPSTANASFAHYQIIRRNGAVVPFEGFQQPHDQYQISQELQLLGQTERWSYVAGFYYFFEHIAETLDQSITFVLPGGQAGFNLNPVSSYFGTSESIAAFGQVSYRPPVLDDKLEVTGGLRATRD